VTVGELVAVLAGWDGDLKVIDKDDKSILGAHIVETKDGPKVKLQSHRSTP
jgi:hypothetical protein